MVKRSERVAELKNMPDWQHMVQIQAKKKGKVWFNLHILIWMS